MSDFTVQDSSTAATYLQIIRRLIADTNGAMEAISRNALSDLELSLWNQEMSCATLKRFLARSAQISSDEKLLLRKELDILKALIPTYEQVVQRAGLSTVLLMDISSLRASASLRSPHSSLSCEA